MTDLKKCRFYSLNFYGGEDTSIAAALYHSVFGWSIRSLSPGHSELAISESVVLVFSRPSLECPVTPGTLTLVIDKVDFELGEIDLNFNRSKNYISYLDPWENRIWFYIEK
jgi:hypothetical protein